MSRTISLMAMPDGRYAIGLTKDSTGEPIGFLGPFDRKETFTMLLRCGLHDDDAGTPDALIERADQKGAAEISGVET
jgi:hypothetical protein